MWTVGLSFTHDHQVTSTGSRLQCLQPYVAYDSFWDEKFWKFIVIHLLLLLLSLADVGSVLENCANMTLYLVWSGAVNSVVKLIHLAVVCCTCLHIYMIIYVGFFSGQEAYQHFLDALSNCGNDHFVKQLESTDTSQPSAAGKYFCYCERLQLLHCSFIVTNVQT